MAAAVPREWRRKVFPYASMTATDLDGLLEIEWKGMNTTRYKHWWGKNPNFARCLRTLGEAGVVRPKTACATKVCGVYQRS